MELTPSILLKSQRFYVACWQTLPFQFFTFEIAATVLPLTHIVQEWSFTLKTFLVNMNNSVVTKRSFNTPLHLP